MMKILALSLVASLLGAVPVWAVSEEGFARAMAKEVWPHFNAGEFGTFTGQGGVEIAFAKFEIARERGALVIVPGKSESYIKYVELIYDLRACGYSLYLFDHRGMGFSGALLDGDPDKTHVECFDYYVADLHAFVAGVVNARSHDRRVVLGHSMGGTVALLYMAEHPGVFDGAILSAPMLEIMTDPLPVPVAYALSALGTWLGREGAYCPGRGPWEDRSYSAAALTGSPARWALWEKLTIPAHALTGMGGATLGWLREALRGARRARSCAPLIQIPVLQLQAGIETMVAPGKQSEACAAMPGCERIHFGEARHEILMERDEIRDSALAQIRNFLGSLD